MKKITSWLRRLFGCRRQHRQHPKPQLRWVLESREVNVNGSCAYIVRLDERFPKWTTSIFDARQFRTRAAARLFRKIIHPEQRDGWMPVRHLITAGR